MTTRSASRTERDDRVVVITWEGLIGTADDGSAVGVADLIDLTVQVVGSFTTSGAVTMQGSQDGATFGALVDDTGSDIVLTDSTVMLIRGNPLQLKPNGTAGTAADMDVIITGKKYR